MVHCTMQYDRWARHYLMILLFLNAVVEDTPDPLIAVIMHDFEQFNPSVVQDIFYIFRCGKSWSQDQLANRLNAVSVSMSPGCDLCSSFLYRHRFLRPFYMQPIHIQPLHSCAWKPSLHHPDMPSLKKPYKMCAALGSLFFHVNIFRRHSSMSTMNQISYSGQRRWSKSSITSSVTAYLMIRF